MMYFLRQKRASKVNKIFGKLQIDSSAFFLLPTEPMMDKKQWVS
jgi:hypothetical protein